MIPGFAKIAVNAPLKDVLTYRVPERLTLTRGSSVLVPLGKRQATGVVVGFDADCSLDEEKIKDITDVNPDRPPLDEAHLTWLEWLSQYYVYPLGQVVELAFAPLNKAGRKKKTTITNIDSPMTPEPTLTDEQKSVLAAIQSSSGFKTHLLFGVTGAGKTEVYMQLLKSTLDRGEKALMLVPEISLTPQVISRFTSRFGDRVAVLHSHLTDRDRTIQWWEIFDGKKDILIGARSALFCPIPQLGLIVVDEEHEPSYKQEEKLKYNGRDAAIVLGHIKKCPVILGSATPSLESWQNAKSGKYNLHKITKRATAVALPEIHIEDLRRKEDSWASPILLESLASTLEAGEQAALFLNRRGMAKSVLCPACGAHKECPNCSISLVLHGATNLVCHYCDYHESLPEICDSCRECELKPIGLGTELIENDLQNYFPKARILRADRDEINSRDALEEFIQKVEAREADFIVGTQMIAKGLDFPHLTLVGVVLADVAMNIPDFRATERTYQLLSQVSGRAGRKVKQGKVIIQTYNPEHISVQKAKLHAFEDFAEHELQARAELGYPPFGKLMLIRFQGLDNKNTETSADKVAQTLLDWAQKHSPQLEVLGPSPAPIFKVRNNFRYHLLLKAPKEFALSKVGWKVLSLERLLPKGVRMLIDVDPLSML